VPVTRRIIGIAGPPGSGKSTLAEATATRLAAEGVPAVVVPMDGFHLADATLDRLGSLDHKGAPETFDAWGYLALLRRLKTDPDHVIYAPGFERDLEQPIAGSIPIGPEVRVVVTEGNYLLLPEEPWSCVRRLLDEAWYVDCDPESRRERLRRRHVEFGKTPEAAAEWVDLVDEPNALLVAATRDRADRIVVQES